MENGCKFKHNLFGQKKWKNHTGLHTIIFIKIEISQLQKHDPSTEQSKKKQMKGW